MAGIELFVYVVNILILLRDRIKMKRALPLLHELMGLVADFDSHATTDEMHLPGFIHWLLQREKEQQDALFSDYTENTLQEGHPSDEQMTPDILLTILVTYLFRYAKHYTKKALDGSPLSTMDDFTFLLTLKTHGNMTKTALTTKHLLEVTSGVEILKRLERQGFVATSENPDDKRSRHVSITESGREILKEMMVKMRQVSGIVAGNLSTTELRQLLPLLMKLDSFHGEIHREDKKSDLTDITQKYLAVSY